MGKPVIEWLKDIPDVKLRATLILSLVNEHHFMRETLAEAIIAVSRAPESAKSRYVEFLQKEKIAYIDPITKEEREVEIAESPSYLGTNEILCKRTAILLGRHFGSIDLIKMLLKNLEQVDKIWIRGIAISLKKLDELEKLNGPIETWI